MSVCWNLSDHPLASSICPWGQQLLSRLPLQTVSCIGLEFSRATSPVDLLIALPVEQLGQAARSLRSRNHQDGVPAFLEHLCLQTNLRGRVDHAWLELDHQSPGRFSAFLGHPGNLQGAQERRALLQLVESCLVQAECESSSRQVLTQIQQRWQNSGLMSRLEAGRHVLSEVGWMNRGDASHLKLLITPGYRQQPLALMERLFGPAMAARLDRQLLTPACTGIDIEREPLNVHISLALGTTALRAAVEISHSPTQQACDFQTLFCRNLQQLPGMGRHAQAVLEHLQTTQRSAGQSALRAQFSHIKIPISEGIANLERSKYYVRLLPREAC